jgi:hypothetical protein
MTIDYSKHSLFGASKAAADLLVQEYGRYFGLPTVSFRGGCLTGPAHAGTELHGFLSYLMICTVKIDRIGSPDTKGNKCGITSTVSILSKHSLNSFARRGLEKFITLAAAGIVTVRCSKQSICVKKLADAD